MKVVACSPAGRFEFLSPSVAIPAFHISDAAEAQRAAAETVTVNQRPWFFGDTALTQSCGQPPVLGLNDDWITTPEHGAPGLDLLSALPSIHGMRGKPEKQAFHPI